MWDKPSAEVTHLKTQCEDMMEKYESEIEDWYNKYQDIITLSEFLCKNRVLRKSKDYKCLSEKVPDADADAEKGDGGEVPVGKTEL